MVGNVLIVALRKDHLPYLVNAQVTAHTTIQEGRDLGWVKMRVEVGFACDDARTLIYLP